MAAIETPITAMDTLENAYGSVVKLAEPRARILSVSDSPFDHAALRRIVDDAQWQLITADSCREAEEKLRWPGTLVVFTDSVLPDGAWKDMLRLISDLEKPPFLVVTSRLAD